MKRLTPAEAEIITADFEQIVAGLEAKDEKAINHANVVLSGVIATRNPLVLHACFKGGLSQLAAFAAAMAEEPSCS
jgi:hypothetical protein